MDRYAEGGAQTAREPEFGTGLVNRQFAWPSLIALCILFGCVSETPVMERFDTPTSTKEIPTATRIPPETITSTPSSPLIVATQTPYLTPLPTLSIEQERVKFYQFYNFINGCRLPCLWGITPGFTTWTEMNQFINQFYSHHHIGEAEWSITKTNKFNTYSWSVENPNPGQDFALGIFMEVQDNVVTAILVDSQLSEYLFPLHRLLDEYGEPESIYLNTMKSEGNTPVYSVDVFIMYDSEYIFSGYRFYEYASTKLESRRVCLIDGLVTPLTLWSIGHELNKDFSESKLLVEYSDENTQTFYQRFRYNGNKCFEMSKDAWD